MNLFNYVRDQIIAIIGGLIGEGHIPTHVDVNIDINNVNVEPPRESVHGDVTTNVAMLLSKSVKMEPRVIARLIAKKLDELDFVSQTNIAGPGFINLKLVDSFWLERLREVLGADVSYGSSDLGANTPINVEYVSANPTGPLHVGHGRGAVFGDALASLLEKVGFAVTREYYVNDGGTQIEILARSLHLRYRQALGEQISEIPEGFYPGDYLISVGHELAKLDGDRWLDLPEEEWLEPISNFGITAMMDLIRDDLLALGIKHNIFTSERELVNKGGVKKALKLLEDRGLIYEGELEPPKGHDSENWQSRVQSLFKSSEFGDDVDRPIKKSDGSWTYFATDIAYHADKYSRGFDEMINIWGADHSGYVKRMTSAVRALSEGQSNLDVKLCQMVNLLENGELVKMSKRAGTYVTLRMVIDNVGKDVVRFIMLTRKNDAQLDFDLARVTDQSRENPVFYVQYAHARIKSVFRHSQKFFTANELSASALSRAPLELLQDPSELSLLKLLVAWPRIVERAALAHEPHRIAFFLGDLSTEFHSLWNKGNDKAQLRFIQEEDRQLTLARLALIKGVAVVIASGLQIIGVVPLEELR